MDKRIEGVLEEAKKRIGVREVRATNTGLEVNDYLKSVHLSPGNPWCAAFVNYCFEQSLKEQSPWKKSGSCAELSTWGRTHDLLRETPQRGDVFLLYGFVKGIYRAHHTGFVLDSGNPFSTIEGNTNLDGSREGIGVFQRDAKRKVGPSVKFIRWIGLMPPEPGTTADPAPTNPILINGKPFITAPVINGKTMCPVRDWGTRMGFAVGWDNDEQTVLFDGQPIHAEISILEDGKAYATIRDLAENAGLQITFDEATHTVNVFR